MSTWLEFAIASLAVYQVVEVAHKSDMPWIARFRSRVQARPEWWSQLAYCAWCFSLWVGFATALGDSAGETIERMAAQIAASLPAADSKTQSAVLYCSTLSLQAFAEWKFVEARLALTVAHVFVLGCALSCAANFLHDLRRSFNRKAEGHDAEEDDQETDGDEAGGGDGQRAVQTDAGEVR